MSNSSQPTAQGFSDLPKIVRLSKIHKSENSGLAGPGAAKQVSNQSKYQVTPLKIAPNEPFSKMENPYTTQMFKEPYLVPRTVTLMDTDNNKATSSNATAQSDHELLMSSTLLHKEHNVWCAVQFTDFTYRGGEKCPAATVHCKNKYNGTRTMDNLINLIGHEKYKIIMKALQSVQDDNLRIKAIAALTTIPLDEPSQQVLYSSGQKSKTLKDTGTMTDAPVQDNLAGKRKRRSRKRQPPYVLENESVIVNVRKTIVDPFANPAELNERVIKAEPPISKESGKDVIDPQIELDNLSDISKVSRAISLGSLSLTPSIIHNHENLALKLAERIDLTDSIEGEYLPPSSKMNDPQSREPFGAKMSTRNQINSSHGHLRAFRRGHKRYHDSSLNSNNCKRRNSVSATSNPLGTVVILQNPTDSPPVLNSNIENSTGSFDAAFNGMDSENSEGNDLMTIDTGPSKFYSSDNINVWNSLSVRDRNLMQGVKPEDWFHIATPDGLKTRSRQDRADLLKLQMYIDFKFCLLADEDNNLPIHNAVLTNDLDLLKRHCLVLKANNESIDIGDANFNYMCVMRGADRVLARTLLQQGASPLAPDDEDRSALHLAAEAASHDYIEMLVEHMACQSTNILKAEQLWTQDMACCTPQELVNRLFAHAITAVDKNGYTPLMLAARCGHAEHAYCMLERLVGCGAGVVNFQAPNSGNTALYLAVEAACYQAEKAGNMSKVADNFEKTIQYLIRYGANPWIENKYGSSVNMLINEYNIGPLNRVINNVLNVCKLTSVGAKYDIKMLNASGSEKKVTVEKCSGSEAYILIKTDSGMYFEDTKPPVTTLYPNTKIILSTEESNASTKRDPEKLKKCAVNKTIGVDGEQNEKLKRRIRAEYLKPTEDSVMPEVVAQGGKIGPIKITKASEVVLAGSNVKDNPKSDSVDTRRKPVILKNIQLNNASDYVKNVQMKPIKLKILDKKYTITPPNLLAPSKVNQTKNLSNPIKISKSKIISVAALRNDLKRHISFVNRQD